jgi:hypothetical protein
MAESMSQSDQEKILNAVKEFMEANKISGSVALDFQDNEDSSKQIQARGGECIIVGRRVICS